MGWTFAVGCVVAIVLIVLIIITLVGFSRPPPSAPEPPSSGRAGPVATKFKRRAIEEEAPLLLPKADDSSSLLSGTATEEETALDSQSNRGRIVPVRSAYISTRVVGGTQTTVPTYQHASPICKKEESTTNPTGDEGDCPFQRFYPSSLGRDRAGSSREQRYTSPSDREIVRKRTPHSSGRRQRPRGGELLCSSDELSGVPDGRQKKGDGGRAASLRESSSQLSTREGREPYDKGERSWQSSSGEHFQREEDGNERGRARDKPSSRSSDRERSWQSSSTDERRDGAASSKESSSWQSSTDERSSDRERSWQSSTDGKYAQDRSIPSDDRGHVEERPSWSRDGEERPSWSRDGERSASRDSAEKRSSSWSSSTEKPSWGRDGEERPSWSRDGKREVSPDDRDSAEKRSSSWSSSADGRGRETPTWLPSSNERRADDRDSAHKSWSSSADGRGRETPTATGYGRTSPTDTIQSRTVNEEQSSWISSNPDRALPARSGERAGTGGTGQWRASSDSRTESSPWSSARSSPITEGEGRTREPSSEVDSRSNRQLPGQSSRHGSVPRSAIPRSDPRFRGGPNTKAESSLPYASTAYPSGAESSSMSWSPKQEEKMDCPPLTLNFTRPQGEERSSTGALPVSGSESKGPTISARGRYQALSPTLQQSFPQAEPVWSASSTTPTSTPQEEIDILSDKTPSTPCHSEEGVDYCTPPSAIDKGIIDVCSYSDSIIYLQGDGLIIRESTVDGKRSLIRSNVQGQRLEHFNGYLHCLSSGTLYRLDNSTYSGRHWRWQLCDWSPVAITHSSTTLSGDYLWLQCAGSGTLYDCDYRIVEGVEMGSKRRVYGANRESYVDIDAETSSALVHPGGDSLNNVADVVLTYHGDAVVLPSAQRETWHHLRLVQWKPYFIPHRDRSAVPL